MEIDRDWMPDESMQDIFGADAIRRHIQTVFDISDSRKLEHEIPELMVEIHRKENELAQLKAELTKKEGELIEMSARLEANFHAAGRAIRDADVARAVIQAVVEIRGWTLTPAQEAAFATINLERLQAMQARATRAERPEELFLVE